MFSLALSNSTPKTRSNTFWSGSTFHLQQTAGSLKKICHVQIYCAISSSIKVIKFCVSDSDIQLFQIHFYYIHLFHTFIFTAAKKTGDRVEYLLMFKDGWKNAVISSQEARLNWPMLLLNYLKKNVRLFQPQMQSLTILTFPIEEGTNVTGEPTKVHCKLSWLKNKLRTAKFINCLRFLQMWQIFEVNWTIGWNIRTINVDSFRLMKLTKTSKTLQSIT